MNSAKEYPDYYLSNYSNLTEATTEEYPDYDPSNYGNQTGATTADSPTCSDANCIFMATVLVIIFILGSAGNGLVIWIAGFKLKKSVNTTWYLSLAVSDFLFCFSLPFTVDYKIREDWIFGLFMCKLMSFVMFLNMFSSIFLLVIISVDRCVAVIFPVWAQNHRTIRKASVIVTLVWIISAGISTPSLIFRAVQPDHEKQTQVCFNDYKYDQNHVSVVVCRFVFGFVIPFLIIIACYVVIIRKLKINQSAKSKKPFKIMTALIVTFFSCWIPFHIFALMELNHEKYERSVIHVGQVIGVTLASANSCLNPFLYAFMGKDFKRKCSALLSKIENAIDEDGRSTMRGTSITTSGERRFSSAV